MAAVERYADRMIAGITGAHWLIYSKDPEADRAFFRDVLGFRAVDAGGGWLIFALPPSELAIHPVEGLFVQRHADHDLMGAVLYLICADVHASVKSLEDAASHARRSPRPSGGSTRFCNCPAAAR